MAQRDLAGEASRRVRAHGKHGVDADEDTDVQQKAARRSPGAWRRPGEGEKNQLILFLLGQCR